MMNYHGKNLMLTGHSPTFQSRAPASKWLAPCAELAMYLKTRVKSLYESLDAKYLTY